MGSMYLFAEGEQRPLPKSAVQRKGDSVEPDAVSYMNELSAQFSATLDYRNLKYDPALTLLAPDRWSSELRAIGGATWQCRKNLTPAHCEGLERVPMDGLAVNQLYREVRLALGSSMGSISTVKGPFGSGVPEEKLSWGDFIRRLNDISEWSALKRDSDGVREMVFSISIAGKREPLIFVAEPAKPPASYFGEVTIIGVKQKGRGRPRTDESRWLKDGITAVFKDLKRRTALADLYAAAPQTSGMPAALRSAIKKGLETVDIPNGSYSREQFSSGRFPFQENRVEVSSSDRDTVLIFSRCSYCGSVDSLSIENGTEAQESVCDLLTARSIEPWHLENCPRFDKQELFYGISRAGILEAKHGSWA